MGGDYQLKKTLPYVYTMAAGDLQAWQSMFIKQLHGFQSWINSYKMSVLFPELKRDLRQSHIEIRGEVLKIIRNELNALAPSSSDLPRALS